MVVGCPIVSCGAFRWPRLHPPPASKSAIERVEALGGSITTAYHNRLGLRVLLKPHKFDPKRMPRQAKPTSVRDRAYYTAPEHRGYLVGLDPTTKAKADSA